MGLAWYQMLDGIQGEINVAMEKLRCTHPNAIIYIKDDFLKIELKDEDNTVREFSILGDNSEKNFNS